MVQFDLPNGYYLRRLDPSNVILVRLRVPKTGGEPTEKVVAYYPDYITAYRGTLKHLQMSATDNEELEKIVSELKSIYSQLEIDVLRAS